MENKSIMYLLTGLSIVIVGNILVFITSKIPSTIRGNPIVGTLVVLVGICYVLASLIILYLVYKGIITLNDGSEVLPYRGV